MLGKNRDICKIKKAFHIMILGGGHSGLAVGFYAKKNGMPFKIYEASNHIGGNSITLKHGDFLFDSGAHRFHNKYPEVTKEIKNLLGEDFMKLNVPGQIYHNGKFLYFPFSILNLIKNLGLYTSTKVLVELMNSRFTTRELDKNFENFVLHTYGKTIGNHFLFNYSEKLWGISCNKLSPDIAGERMKGLNLKTLFTEVIFGQKANSEHMEGSFYYPKTGIGAIAEKLGKFCGEENILLNSRVTKIFHNRERIQAVEINSEKRIETYELVSALPINLFLHMMEPKPPNEVLQSANYLSYRNLILVALFLNRESVTNASTVYFPDSNLPFTRVYEPKNRSVKMSPRGKTSLIVEIPCRQGDKFWSLKEEKIIQLIRSQFIKIGFIKEEEIIDASVVKMNFAYPILEIGYKDKVKKINTFLKSFSNLKITGRNGRFTYAWIHDMIKFGKEIIEEYMSFK